MTQGERREPCSVAAIPSQGIVEGTMAGDTDQQSQNQFVDDLCVALKGDRTLARRLGPVLWKAVVVAREPDDESDIKRWHEAARAEADKAKAIARQTCALLACLMDDDPIVPPAILQARSRLVQLARAADAWASRARGKATQRRGPKIIRARIELSEWVALQLQTAGVRPTKSKIGIFAHVLAVVQHAAGFPGRDIERDVRRALEDRFVADYLAELRAAITT
jgi:hypothetical protein